MSSLSSTQPRNYLANPPDQRNWYSAGSAIRQKASPRQGFNSSFFLVARVLALSQRDQQVSSIREVRLSIRMVLRFVSPKCEMFVDGKVCKSWFSPIKLRPLFALPRTCVCLIAFSCVRVCFCIQAIAEEAHPSRNVIALEESKLTVYKKTASNSFTEG